MKKALIILTLALTGCATTPPKPAVLMSDAEMCTEAGHALAVGNAARYDEMVKEGDKRLAAKTLHIDEAHCRSYATLGQNRAQQERAEAAASEARWQNFSAGMQAAAAQQQQQQAEWNAQAQAANAQAMQQMQQQQQNMQMQRQTQALESINRQLGGW